MIKIIIAFLMGALSGYVIHQAMFIQSHLKCNTYATKYAVWVGYVSYNHKEVRCFWLENEYPRRVRTQPRVVQGLVE